MQKFAIQKFTAPKTGHPISVNLAEVFAVQPNDGSGTKGVIYDGAGALLVTRAGYNLPVQEQFGTAQELWASALNNMSGTA